MRKIIEGKIYNTETATELAHYEYGEGRRDFRYVWEALYRTPKGAYFTAGEGGPMTRYARSCGDNSTCGGEGLFVLTEAEAKEWMERHGSADQYVAAFGVPEEA